MTPDPAATVPADPALTVPVTDLSPDWPTVPGYDILGEIARGGMGVVYRARHRLTDRIVALKTLTHDRPPADAIARFRLEAGAAAALDHPGIVPVYDVGETDGRPYLSMKLIPGGSLATALANPDWQPSLREKVAMVAQVARAVAHAHQRGVIHRDLKPGNVLIGDAGPMVADFGLAKRLTGDSDMTHTGALIGTPAYMSPEQAAGDGKTATTLSDVWALGVILYELLAGRRPFAGATPLDVLRQVTDSAVVPPSKHNPSASADLEAVCLKCLAKVPADRYPSADALAADLEAWAAGKPVSVRPPSVAFLMWDWLRANVRTAVWLILIGVGCSLVAASTIWRAYWALLLVRIRTRPGGSAWAAEPDWAVLYDILDLLPRTDSWAATVTGTGAVSAIGLLTAIVTRGRDRWADLTAGLGVGVVSGLTLTFCGGLQLVLTGSVILPHIAEYELLANGYFDPQNPAPPTGGLLTHHPDLALVQAADRGDRFADRLINDQLSAVMTGVWAAPAACAFIGLVIGVVPTMLAGFLRRRYPSWQQVVPRYALLTVVCFPLFSELLFRLASARGTVRQPALAFADWVIAPTILAVGWACFFRTDRVFRRPASVMLILSSACALLIPQDSFAALGAIRIDPTVAPGVIGLIVAVIWLFHRYIR